MILDYISYTLLLIGNLGWIGVALTDGMGSYLIGAAFWVVLIDLTYAGVLVWYELLHPVRE